MYMPQSFNSMLSFTDRDYGFIIHIIVLCLFAVSLIAAAVIDFKYTYVPDGISIFIVFLAIIHFFFGQHLPLASYLLGSFSVAGFMLLLSWASNGGIGGGDIKLFAASGLLLGFKNNVLAFFLGYVLAALFCIPLICLKKLNRGSMIPMVPFFAVSLLTAALWGDQLIRLYLEAAGI